MIEAATVDLSEQIYLQLANKKKNYKRKQKILGKGVRISMIRVEQIIYTWHDLSLVLVKLRFYLVHW